MAREWHVRVGDKQYGPFSFARLRQLAVERRVTPESLVREKDGGQWVAASTIQGLFSPAASPHSVPPPTHGAGLPETTNEKRNEPTDWWRTGVLELQEWFTNFLSSPGVLKLKEWFSNFLSSPGFKRWKHNFFSFNAFTFNFSPTPENQQVIKEADEKREKELEEKDQPSPEKVAEAEVVPRAVEIENGGSSGAGGVALTTSDQERRNRLEKRVAEKKKKEQQAQKYVGIGCLAILLIFFLFCAGPCSSCSNNKKAEKSEAEKQAESEELAFYMAIQFIKKELRNPSTAEFCKISEAIVHPLGNNRYMVAGYVNSQNGFGGMSRATWAVTIEDQGEQWRQVERVSWSQ